jgi:hypothetical protein
MARFSQAFLQGLLNPSYQQGLFEAARGVGQTPGIMAMQERRQEQMQRMQGMGPVDLASMAEQQALQTGDPTEILKARQAKQQVVQGRTQESLNQLDLERQRAVQEGNIAKANQIESVMERVATSAGLDASKITGRTEAENNAILEKREQGFSDAYYKVKPENREKFVKAATEAGFGSLMDELELDRQKKEDYQLERQEKADMARAPLPTSTLQERVDVISDEGLREDYNQRLEDIKAMEPNFDKGETWNPGEKKNAERLLDSLSDDVSGFKQREVLERRSAKRNIESAITQLQKELTRISPTGNQVDEQMPQARKNVGGVFVKNEVIEAEAVRLASLKIEQGIRNQIADYQAQLESFNSETAVTPSEDTEDDDVIDL